MNLKPFLENTKYVDFLSDIIKEKAKQLFAAADSDLAKAETAFLFVRDQIPHSADINSDIITAKASDVLKHGTGICHAKSNLLAALLRSQNIPAGFCFQRMTLAEDDSKGYVLHAFNAVYLDGKWIKLDARGNKMGVNAQFSNGEPVLAFPVRPQYDEYFIKGIFAAPDERVMALLSTAKSRSEVFTKLPGDVLGKPDIQN